MSNLKSFIEAYLDDENQFWDYKTGKIEGSDIFDTSKTGMSYYDDFLKDPKYMETDKNLKGEIKYLTPREYFEACADIFNSSASRQIEYTSNDVKTIDHLNKVIDIYQKKFPLTFINYADKQQEGRHRMYVAGERFGWDKKHPVLIITVADEELQKQKQNEAEKRDLDYKVRLATKESLQYKYKNINEFKDQLQWDLNRKFNGFDSYEDVDFTLDATDYEYTVRCNGGEYSFNKDDIKIIEEEPQSEESVMSDEELDDWLLDYLDDYDIRSDAEKEQLRDKIRNA